MARLTLIVAAFPAVLALAGAAFAGAAQQHRWLDRTGTSSGCIGDSATPECAVETLLACRLRRDAALCAAVGVELPALEAEATSLRTSGAAPDPFTVLDPQAAEYRIETVLKAGAGSVRVTVAIRFHGADGLSWPEAGWRRMQYALQGDGGGWRVEGITWQPMVRLIEPSTAAGSCIGRTGTPVCAVETHIACRVRNDADLCARAGRVEAPHFRPKGASVLYYVGRIRRWEPPEHAAPGALFVIVETRESTQWQPGTRPGEEGGGTDSGAVVIRPGFVAVAYTLERRAGAWRVVNRVERP